MADSASVLPHVEQMSGAVFRNGRGIGGYIRGENGRLRSLITLLDEGERQGYAAWRVLPAPEEWQTGLQAGLSAGEIGF